MAKYELRSEFISTNAEGIQKIPQEWQIKQVRYLLKAGAEGIKIGPFGSALKLEDMVEDGFSVYGQENVIKKDFTLGKRKISETKFQEMFVYKIFPKDILITMMGTSGKCEIVPADIKNGIIDSHLLRVRVEEDQIIPEFFKLLIDESPEIAYQIQVFGKGSIMHGLNSGIVKSLNLPLPPIKEQKFILSFLDHETAKIDSLIAKQEKLIELLKEKRQAVISGLVNVKENENTIQLKYAVDILAGYSFPSSGFKTEDSDGVALLRGVNVGVGYVKWSECVWWSVSSSEGIERYVLQEGDLVFGMDRPWISSGARVAEILERDLPCYLVQRVARIRPKMGFYQPYIKILLASEEFKSFIESDLTGVSVPHISTDQITSFDLRNLSYEQQVILTDQANYLIDQTKLLIDKAQSAIQLMQERRTALISAAVTGKIDVRDWAQAPVVDRVKVELSV